MAYWDRLSRTGNVQDRRGLSPLAVGGGGLGLVGVVLVLALNFLGGGSPDLNSVLQQLQQADGASQQSGDASEFAGVDDYEKFASAVLGSTNETWGEVFSSNGKQYTEPTLVLFRSATNSGCGLATSQVGPHYCPTDQTIYIDETFFDELKKFGSQGGDVAEAYVIAHEVGHHVQHQLGTLEEVQGMGNAQSVQLELQADCFAGVWAYSISNAGVFEPGETKEALDAAAAVGDDRIQQTIEGRVNPESWTHGSSEQRVHWFTTGLNSSNPSACSTFN